MRTGVTAIPLLRSIRRNTGMSFSQSYPDRIILGEDGVYRWSVQVDPKQDRYSRDLFRNIMLIVCGSVCAFTVLMMISLGDLSMVWIPFACCGFILLISIPLYRLAGQETGNPYPLAYEMNNEAILMISDRSLQNRTESAALITHVLKQETGRGPVSNAAIPPVLTRFRSIRRIVTHRDTGMLELKLKIGQAGIWVPAEDLDMVRVFIRQHADIPVRPVRWPKRLGLACLFSLLINTVIAAYNAMAFRSTGRLPVSVSSVHGDVIRQDAVGMYTMFLAEGASREQPWWMNKLRTDGGSAVLCFLAAALIIFLVLTVFGMLRSDSEYPGASDDR